MLGYLGRSGCVRVPEVAGGRVVAIARWFSVVSCKTCGGSFSFARVVGGMPLSSGGAARQPVALASGPAVE
eukprot:11190604-Lingulodinium_polyedra.AAC.1